MNLLSTKKFIKSPLFLLTIIFISLLLSSNYSYAQISQISRQPYLQKAAQHSMLIAWRSSSNANYELYYGSSPTSQPNMLASSGTTKHAVTITGLAAYTQYYYKICDVGGSPCTNVEYFYTAKPDTELSTDILVFGDCGMNNTPQKNLAAKMLTASNNNEFDFGLVCGDVTQQDGTDYDTYYFDIYKDILKNRCYYTAIGNHDLYGYPADNGTAQQYLEDFYLFTNNPQNTEEYYSFEYGNAKIIALHVNFVNDYQPGSPQYEWLIDELECRTTEWVFVYFHQPPFTNAWDALWYLPFQPYFQYDGEDDVRNHLVPVFETYGVDMVFNGHMHGYERGELNGVKYVTSGGGGGNLDDSKPNDWPHISVQNFIHHYLIVNINGMSVDVTAIDQNDNIVDNFTISKTVSTALVAAWDTTTLCETAAPIDLNTLLHPNATVGGTWSGAGVTANNFDPTGLSGSIPITYTLGAAPCTKELTQNIVIALPDASWAASTIVCDSDPILNLNTLITTGLPNGTWSGTGVTSNNFDPTGLSGSIPITYTVNDAGCINSLTQNITVEATPNVTWTTPSTPLCSDDTPIDLMTLLDVNADNSGTWSGTGVITTNFDPAGLAGNIAVTYTVNNGGCIQNSTQNIVVNPIPDASWMATTTLCDSDPIFDLNTLITTGLTNGTWSGTGVTSNNFDPTGLSGSIPITYTVNNASCTNSLTQNITIEATPNVTWTTPTTPICDNDAAIDLITLLDVNADNSGTWSGTGVTGTNFNPAGLNGSIAVNYSVNGANCSNNLTQNIVVEAAPNVTWTTPSTPICADDVPLDLMTLLAINADNSGTWSGTGVTGTNFDPSALSGSIAVTYSANGANCSNNLTQNIVVEAAPNVTWTTPSTPICADDVPLDLMTLLTINADNSGTWSGTGVTGTNFDPAGLNGNIAVNYSVNGANCSNNLMQNIVVEAAPNVTWTAPSSLCDTDPPLNLTTLLAINADNSGTWSGTGVTGTNFDPTGLNGNIPVNYSVNGANCSNNLMQNIVVEAAPNVTWTAPSSLCDTDPPLNLTTLLAINADNSGTWSGTGVTGTNFDPTGLNGNIPVNYSVNGANCSNNLMQNILVSSCTVIAKIRVFLQGSYNNTTGLMSTNLRTNNILPLTQPFNTTPWQYTGTESVVNMSSIPNDVTDWVLVELRDASNYNTIVAQRAAFLRNDGFIVDIDGVTNGVLLPSLATSGSNYYLVVRSRNHLATMSATAVTLPNVTTYDFSTAVNQAFGASQMISVGSGVFAQYAGDFNGNGIINVADFNTYDDELSSTGTYSAPDANMDNTVSISDFNAYRPNASVIGVRVLRY